MKADYAGEVVWIIGAGSGIGAALAGALAARGARTVLSGRRVEALESLARTLPGEHSVAPLDVTDAQAVCLAAQALHTQFGRIDRTVFLAAAYTPMQLDALDVVACREMVTTNVLGALHVIRALVPLLKTQSSGQIALCGSVAGYIGLPGGQPYSATKAAIINLAQSLRAELPARIDVKLISPGFVRTPLTDKNHFAMPAIIEPAQAAVCIADGLRTRAFEVHFPKRLTLCLKLLALLPYRLSFAFTRMFNK